MPVPVSTARVPKLLVFTDDVAPRRHGRALLSTLARACADLVVEDRGDLAVCVRAKHLDADARRALTLAVVDVVDVADIAVFAHDDAGLAAALRLDGVHLAGGRDDDDDTARVRAARLRLPPGAVLGLSSHPRHAGDRCTRDDVDYVTWSPVFAPASKQDARAPIGVAALQGHRPPVLALGGVDVDRVAACRAAGARGVAVIGAVLGVADPARALQQLLIASEIPFRRRRRGVHPMPRAA
ncbi:MAG TPA: thiamine phosphate synthase [Myxococcota bacterium]